MLSDNEKIILKPTKVLKYASIVGLMLFCSGLLITTYLAITNKSLAIIFIYGIPFSGFIALCTWGLLIQLNSRVIIDGENIEYTSAKGHISNYTFSAITTVTMNINMPDNYMYQTATLYNGQNKLFRVTKDYQGFEIFIQRLREYDHIKFVLRLRDSL